MLRTGVPQMVRWKKGFGRTGKNGKKKESEARPKEDTTRSHKKQPKPVEQRELERQERVAAWLASPAGQREPQEQNQCDCALGLQTRRELHDLFCPFLHCFAFDVGCCEWETDECYPECVPRMRACDCMFSEHAKLCSRYRSMKVDHMTWERCPNYLHCVRPDEPCSCEWMARPRHVDYARCIRVVGRGKICMRPGHWESRPSY